MREEERQARAEEASDYEVRKAAAPRSVDTESVCLIK